MVKTILIVDDNAENLYILQTLLQSQGMSVTTAENGRKALELALAKRPDLIISDILMPVMDGYALCRACKADDALKSVPFIFYTATYTDPADEKFALDLGAQRFVIKPQEPAVLFDLIQEYLDMPRAADTGTLPPLGSEMEFFRQHNAVLFHKLERKMTELQQTNERLNGEIAERKRAEEKLLRLTQAMEENPVGILLTDLDGNIEYANPKFSRISGYSFGEVESKNVGMLRAKEMPAAIYQDLWRTVTAGDVWRGELCNRRKDGEPYWVYLTTSPMRNAMGRIINYLAMMEDISQRRKLEEQLRQAQKLEGIGQMAGGVAHDFNNILTAIIGFAYIAQLNISKDDPLQAPITQILDYAQKATSITKSLLAFSRKQTTRLARHDLNALIANFHEFLRRFLPENIDIEIKPADKPLPVLVDSVQIEQVIMNLATNSRDAMPSGGHLLVSARLIDIDDEYIRTHGYGLKGLYAEIAVSDTGCGMDIPTREKIFEPFFTTKEEGKGTGLGMAIVYGIIKNHNGYISVYSELGKGTLFRIVPPLVQGAVKAGVKPQDIEPANGTETILIAEDEEGIRDLMTIIFRERGYTVIAAADGEETLRQFLAHRESIALVMLDAIMPKKNGAQVLHDIRKLKPDMKVLFVSGYAENITDREDLRDKNVHFLQKPVLPSSILKTVRNILDGD